jgi:hypothetical protein
VAVEHARLRLLHERSLRFFGDKTMDMTTALAGYDGALLVVSHDDDFLTAIGIERRIALGR